jgi:putative ABC transport system permease protein
MTGIFSQLQRRTPLGWLQLRREKGRLLVALAGIAFADVLMFMQLGFQNALFESNTRLHRALQADLVLLSSKARNLQSLSTFSRRRLYQAMDTPGVKSAESFYTNTLSWRNPQTRQDNVVQLIAFDPDHAAIDLPEVNQQLELLKLPDTVLFDRGSSGAYQEMITELEHHQTVTTEIEGRTITVAGLFRLGASFSAEGNLITSDQNFLVLFPRRQAASISLGLVALEPGADPQQVVTLMRSHLPNDVQVMTKLEFAQLEENYLRSESPIAFIFGLGTAMAFSVGVVIVYQVLSTDVNAHLREYATFKAMGYDNTYLLFVVFEEAIILAVLGFIPGAMLPVGLYALAANATALPIYMTTARAVFVFVLTMVMCGVSGAIATRKLQSADPADMF